jgi:hypothetical protein
MRHTITFLLIVFVAGSAAGQGSPTQSVSLRLGVPIGVTYKAYFGKKEALEFGLGSASPYWADHYYINSFNSFSKYKDFKYLDHSVTSTIYLQARYLKDFPIPTTGMVGNLNWYCGAGAVLKIASVNYRYTNVDANPPTQSDKHTDIDFGPEAIIGAEYWLEDTPFSFYGEGSVMLELFDRLGGRAFGAVGARYHFSR